MKNLCHRNRADHAICADDTANGGLLTPVAEGTRIEELCENPNVSFYVYNRMSGDGISKVTVRALSIVLTCRAIQTNIL